MVKLKLKLHLPPSYGAADAFSFNWGAAGDSPPCFAAEFAKPASMLALLDKHRRELARLCVEHGVRHLAVFGSAAREDFDPATSDVDLYVEFRDTLSPGYADRYLDFAMAVERLLGRPVDLVTPRSLQNPHFKRALQADQVELYAA